MCWAMQPGFLRPACAELCPPEQAFGEKDVSCQFARNMAAKRQSTKLCTEDRRRLLVSGLWADDEGTLSFKTLFFKNASLDLGQFRSL